VPIDNPPDAFTFYPTITDVSASTSIFGARGGDTIAFTGSGFNSFDGIGYRCFFFGTDDSGRYAKLSSVTAYATSTTVCNHPISLPLIRHDFFSRLPYNFIVNTEGYVQFTLNFTPITRKNNHSL
jgi:hypothetical protein